MSILITLVKGQFYVCKDLFTTESFIRQIELGEETLFGTCFLVCVCSCVCMCICVTLLCSYIIPISFCSHHLPCLPFAGILSTQSPYSSPLTVHSLIKALSGPHNFHYLLLFSFLLCKFPRSLSDILDWTGKAQSESETEGQDKARPGSTHWLYGQGERTVEPEALAILLWSHSCLSFISSHH